MVSSEDIEDVSDVVVLKKKGLQSLIDDYSNVSMMNISQKQSTEMTEFSHKASAAVARQILFETKSNKLLESINKNIK